jgi:hypothetical protein
MPRLEARGEVFEILYDFKRGDLDIGEAYDSIYSEIMGLSTSRKYQGLGPRITRKPKKRKLSAWNKYVKANSKKPRFRYRNGKLNLKKMAVAFRKTPAGKKKRR